MQLFITYLLTAMLSWVPVTNLTPYGETEDQAMGRMHSIAEDIATVVLDRDEPPIFAAAEGRIKSGLLLASIASFEGGFQKFVDDGICNRRDFIGDRRGNCDGHHAFSLWQIHVAGDGYLLLEDGSLGSVYYSPPDVVRSHPNVIKGPELIADRKTAIRVAQRIARDSLKRYHSLCAYSGESCDDDTRHPKAKARLERAVEYYRHHPYVDPLPEPVTIASNP
jgi:hypothetical protein